MGGLPNPNPTELPKLPLFVATPNPLNVKVDLGGLEVLKKPPALPVPKEELKEFDEVFPKRLFALEFVSFSSKVKVDLPNGDTDPLPNGPLNKELPNRRSRFGLLITRFFKRRELEPNANLAGVVDAEPKENADLKVEGVVVAQDTTKFVFENFTTEEAAAVEGANMISDMRVKLE